MFKKISLIVLALAIIAISYTLYFAFMSIGSQPTAPTADMLEEEREMLKNSVRATTPPTEEDQIRFVEIAQKLAIQTDIVDVTGCIIEPMVAHTLPQTSIVFVNKADSNVSITTSTNETITIAGNSSEKFDLKDYPSFFTYVCDFEDRSNPGWILHN